MRKVIIGALAILFACAAPADMGPLLPASIDGLRVVHPQVVTVTVTPLDTTVVATNTTLQFVGTPRDGQGRVLRASSWNWKTSDTTVAVVSQTGLVTSRGYGHVIIVATAFPPWRR
jgi:hypothetical protein